MYCAKQNYLLLENALQFRLSTIKKKKENFFIAETNDREKTSKTLNNYMTVLSYVGKTLLFLPGVGSGASPF